jgi:hypothetical protein
MRINRVLLLQRGLERFCLQVKAVLAKVAHLLFGKLLKEALKTMDHC